MRAALLQLTSSDQPEENLARVCEMMARAVAQGAAFILTPEVFRCAIEPDAQPDETKPGALVAE